MTVRTRMAPSPTGEYHIGGMRTLLYNYAFARKNVGQFILRIEDTDRERFVEGATERLIEVINDYGLGWDEGPVVGGPYQPYVQSERSELYKKYADQLIKSGHAYYCFCTKERLDELRKKQAAEHLPSTKYDKHCLLLSKEEVKEKLASGTPHVIRLNVPANQEVSYDDLILGHISFPTNDVDDQVLLKSDGFPTYHLAVTVDDHLMKISHVLRGVEWLPSTPKHILLYKALDWEMPMHAHLPLLKEKGDTKKMSKRMGSVNATEFLLEGYLPRALLNFLMFLGWNPGTEKEIYSLEEFIAEFSLEKVHKTDLVAFDRDKLFWYNGYYIRNTESNKLLEEIRSWAKKFCLKLNIEGSTGNFDEAYHTKVVDLVKDRMKVLSEYNQLTHYFYQDPSVSEQQLAEFSGNIERGKEIISNFAELYGNVEEVNWTKDHLDKISHEMINEEGYKTKEAFMTLRVALTGETATPPVSDIAELLGKKTVLKRLSLK